jgi:hypothetical protein
MQSLRQTLAVRGKARAEAATRHNRAAAGLAAANMCAFEKCCPSSWESLASTSRQRGIVVDIDVGAPHHGCVAIHCVEQHQRLAILVAGRIEKFVVLCGELPIRNFMTAWPFDQIGRRPLGNVAAVASGSVQNSTPTTSLE